MKLQRTTLVLLLLAILLGGFVYLYEIQWKSQQEQVKKKQQQLFSFKENDVKVLKITTPSATITLERAPKPGKTKWLMKYPDKVPANDGTVAYLLDLLEKENTGTPSESLRERTLNISTSQLAEFGLKQPQATIDITLNNQQTHKLVLGNKPSFNERLVYARNQFTPQTDKKIPVVLVSNNFENAIKRSLSEWKAEENNNKSPSPTPEANPTISPNGATPAIKPIPINPTPKAVPNKSTPTVAPNSKSTPTPTPTPAKE